MKGIHKNRSVEENASVERILCEEYQCPKPVDSSIANNWTYAMHVYGVLLDIFDELAKQEEFPLTVNDAKNVHIGIRKVIEYGLKPFLLGVSSDSDNCLPYIIANVNILLKLTSYKYFPIICTRNDQHLLYTDVLSSIFFVLSCESENSKPKFQEYLKDIQLKLSHADFFKILFLIQGNNKSTIQPISHKQLMQTLYRSGSFLALCEALLPSITSLDQDEEIVKKRLHSSAVVSSIVTRRGHNKQFYHTIIDEIHQHLLNYIRSKRSHQLFYIDVGVQCLSKLCTLQLKFIIRHIQDNVFGLFDRLATPVDMIAGAIVCESNEFVEAINLAHLTFCASGPSDNTLPSELLIPFMPLFFQIHNTLNPSTNKILKNEILALIVRCLSNQEKAVLNRIVETILYEEYGENEKYLHPRVKIECLNNSENEIFTLKIVSTDSNKDSVADDMDISSFLRSSTALVNLLKQSNHNVLTYNVFLHLLRMFSENFASSNSAVDSSSSELLESENELTTAIEKNFKRKYVIIHALNELILFKSFHGQFTENPHDIISMLDHLLNQQIHQIEMKKTEQKSLENNDEILILILSIVGDFMQRIQNDELKNHLKQTLNKLRTCISNSEMDTVLKKIDIVLESRENHNFSSEFLVAKSILCETHSEPYTKVYAIMTILKLIEKKDEETILNAHTVLALAMKMLKEADSYIFLNCIKLLVALFDLLNETVLDALISEYHFDIDSDAADIDFKLKVGETIVKVTQALGQMCYKYKSMLVNCFLRGAYNQNDEFRTSNMSNLGAIMQLLSYQVHHFFQEVISMKIYLISYTFSFKNSN